MEWSLAVTSYYLAVTSYFPILNPGPDIWLEYTQYSIGGMASPDGIERVRSIFERAVTAVGLHMTKGQIVWEAFREFENAILSTLQVGNVFSSLAKHLMIFFQMSTGSDML